MAPLAVNLRELKTVIATHNPDKLNMLINCVAHSVDEYFADCEAYDAAIDILQLLYVKLKNEVFARLLLATRKQERHSANTCQLQSS